MNDSFFDGQYHSSGAGPYPYAFTAGELIVLTASEPDALGPDTFIELRFGETVIDQPFPGTIEYRVPQSEMVAFEWGVSTGNVTWDVSCTEAERSVPTSKEQCKDDGYLTFIDPRTGEPFKNQGHCVVYITSQS